MNNTYLAGIAIIAANYGEDHQLNKLLEELGVHTGWLPGTINLENPDPNCDLDYMAGGSAHIPCEYAMCNSFGFGGTNASLILKKWND